MNKFALLGVIILAAFAGCGEDEATPPEGQDVTPGKNRFTTMIDGDSREYYVHVPASYNANTATPVVFMLHGTSGDGERFYNISGWKEVGEAENILTVFPSSWHHCVIDEGQATNTTKWNIYPGSFEYCEGEVPRDDIKFLRQIITELKGRYNVDEKRIYLLGFSNGGQMAYRCGVEMSDVLAAVVENAGSSSDDIVRTPKRNIPVTFQFGNEDDRFFSSPVPLSGLETGLKMFPFFKSVITAHCGTFKYQSDFTITGDTNTVSIATFASQTAGETRTFNIVMVKGLAHQYPNGTNHWMNGAARHWDWLKQFSLP